MILHGEATLPVCWLSNGRNGAALRSDRQHRHRRMPAFLRIHGEKETE